MKNIFLVFIQDLKRISTNVVAIVVLIGLTVIPSLYAWFNTLSNWDPYGTESTSRIKVAVASDDPGVTIDGVTVNIGDQIISNLKANTTIGWVFTDSTQEAIDGVYSGDYYAALVLPSDFTSDMVSFLSDSLEHPQIQYYCNQKKNAIAPKITDKAKKAVQSQTNSTFVNTLTKSLVSASSAAITVDFDSLTLDDTTGNSLIDVISGKLTDAYNELQTYNVMLDSLISITQISSDVSSLARSSSSDLPETLDTQAGELAALQKLLDANSVSSLSEVSASLSENVSSIRSVMSSISSLYQDMDGDMNTFTDAVTQGQENLTLTQQTLNTLMTKLSDSIELLNKIASDPEYDFVNEILGSDPQTLADFIASPVEITTKKIYEISAYGLHGPFHLGRRSDYGGYHSYTGEKIQTPAGRCKAVSEVLWTIPDILLYRTVTDTSDCTRKSVLYPDSVSAPGFILVCMFCHQPGLYDFYVCTDGCLWQYR